MAWLAPQGVRQGVSYSVCHLPGLLCVTCVIVTESWSKMCLLCVAVQVLLLDEVTVDMDVVARLDLLDFFRCFHCSMLCSAC